MKQRRQRACIKAANDNDVFWSRAAARPVRDVSGMPFIPRRQHPSDPLTPPLRTGVRPLLATGISALVVVALCGAFLIGLAFVGLLALVIVALELARGQLFRPARVPLGGLDHQVVG